MKAILEPNYKAEEKRKAKDDSHDGSEENINNNLEFATWYEGIQDDLLETSHDEYR